MVDEGGWRAELDRWLEPFPAELNHAARRSMCPHYIAGLIGLGERKSMQPMAARQDGLSYDRLQLFISVGRWDEAPLARALLAEADHMVGGRDAMLVIDDPDAQSFGRPAVAFGRQQFGDDAGRRYRRDGVEPIGRRLWVAHSLTTRWLPPNPASRMRRHSSAPFRQPPSHSVQSLSAHRSSEVERERNTSSRVPARMRRTV